MKKKTAKTIKSYPKNASDVPATQSMLYIVRDELNSKFLSLEYKFMALEHRVVSEVHKIALLIEEQNVKNNIVLDGLTNLFARQERIENHILELRK